MVDLGLAGLVDRFEREFGVKWTRRLLFLIGLTVAVTCAGLIWTFLGPILSSALALILDDKIGVLIARIIAFLVFVIYVPVLLSTFADKADSRSVLRETIDIKQEAEAAHEKAREFHHDTEMLNREMRKLLTETGDLCLQVLDAAKDVSPTQHEQLRADIQGKLDGIESFLDQLTKARVREPERKDDDR